MEKTDQFEETPKKEDAAAEQGGGSLMTDMKKEDAAAEQGGGLPMTDGKTKKDSLDITKGKIWKCLLSFFFPLLLGSFFQQMYNTADAVVVGKFVGKEALSAVGGTTGTIINLLVGFFIGVSAGATVSISQYYGGRHKREVSRAVHTAAALALAGGAVIMVLGLTLAPLGLKAMGTPKDILPHAAAYIRIYFCGMIPNIVYNMGAGILRAAGDSRRPLYFLIICCFTNIVLDLVFVAVLHLGVQGAAIATILSQLVSALLVCRVLLKTKDSYRLSIRHIRFYKAILIRMVRIGLPAGFQSMMYNITNILIQSTINRFGTVTIAGWTAYGKIDGIFWMIIGSFGISITTFSGQNFGAGKYGRVRRGVKSCYAMAAVVAVCLSTLLYFGGRYVFMLFTSEADVIEKGMEILTFMVPFFFTYITIEILSGTLRGLGSTLVPLLLTLFGVCILRITWITFAVPVWRDIKTVAFSYPLAWITTSILFVLYYRYYVKKHHIQ